MPAPPSVLALPPIPSTTCAPRVEGRADDLAQAAAGRGERLESAIREPPSPDTSAISTTAVSPRRAYAVVTGSPVGPVAVTGTRSNPAETAASTVPSPPSATGTVTTVASDTRRMPAVSAAATWGRSATP